MVQPFEETLVPPLERVMARAETFVVGAVVSVVNPMDKCGMVGVSDPPKAKIALTEIFWLVTESACIAACVSWAAVLA